MIGSGRIHPARLCCQSEFHSLFVLSLSSALVLSAVAMYLLRIMIPHYYHRHRRHHLPTPLRVSVPHGAAF